MADIPEEGPFMNAGAGLPMEWVAKLIFALLPEKGSLVLVMDRTNWKFGDSNINMLMLGISYKNVAFPLMFRMLDKRGNSNMGERIALLKDFMAWFGKDRIDCLLADREFVGKDWLGFLNQKNIRYQSGYGTILRCSPQEAKNRLLPGTCSTT